MQQTAIISLACGGLNAILLAYRRREWTNSKYRWYGVTALAMAGGILLLAAPRHIIALALETPLIFSLWDLGLRYLSRKIHGRDYYLWLRYSSDLENPNVKFKATDRFFSIFNLFFVIALAVAPAVCVPPPTP